jgi:hypothetical protein
MKIFDFEKYYDYGWEFFFQILTFRRFALLDFTLQWDDDGGDEIFPAICLSIGSHHLVGFSFRWNRFYFDVDMVNTRRRDLEWYRRTYD